ncbi:MAG: ArgE/DapE family deacylase [Candidatus Bathyarchaeota archaeon]|nr:ArgE/DapE family deacylase [Candidatus Bathyarchaeota archaeon]
MSSSLICDVLERIDSLRLEVVSVTSDLIKFQTISPPSNTLECAEYVKAYLEEAGVEVSFYAKEKEKVNVHARVQGRTSKKIVWLGHLDVVPAGLRDKWVYDPFSGIVDGERVYGRGSSDMKGSCAAAMIAAKVLNEFSDNNKATVDFWFTCDEEVGSPNGTRWLVERGLISGDLCIIGDSLSRDPSKEPYIDVGCKGYIRLRLKATGKTAHGSMPFYGDNAIEKILSAIENVKKISDYNLTLSADLEDSVKSSIEYLLAGEGLSEVQKNAIRRAFHYPTVSLTMISGGVKINVIPDYAEAFFDIRISPSIDLENIKKHLYNLVSSLGERGVEVDVIDFEGGYYENWDSRYTVSLRKAVEIATGVEPKPKILLGATDALILKKTLKIPCLGFGAGIEELAHAPNEYVAVSGLLSAAKVYTVLPLLL